MFNKIIEVNLIENNGDLYLRSHGIWKKKRKKERY